MQHTVKDVGEKTAGGIATGVATYYGTLTVSDVQAYAVIFASLTTGIYYCIIAYKAWKSLNRDKTKP